MTLISYVINEWTAYEETADIKSRYHMLLVCIPWQHHLLSSLCPWSWDFRNSSFLLQIYYIMICRYCKKIGM